MPDSEFMRTFLKIDHEDLVPVNIGIDHNDMLVYNMMKVVVKNPSPPRPNGFVKIQFPPESDDAIEASTRQCGSGSRSSSSGGISRSTTD